MPRKPAHPPAAPPWPMPPNPPNLARWRQTLFNVDRELQLSEEEYNVLWQYIDNVYLHQRAHKVPDGTVHHYTCRMSPKSRSTAGDSLVPPEKRRRTATRKDRFPGAGECAFRIKVNERHGAVDGVERTWYTIVRTESDTPDHTHDLDEMDKMKMNSVIRNVVQAEVAKEGAQTNDILQAMIAPRETFDEAGGRHFQRQHVLNAMKAGRAKKAGEEQAADEEDEPFLVGGGDDQPSGGMSTENEASSSPDRTIEMVTPPLLITNGVHTRESSEGKFRIRKPAPRTRPKPAPQQQPPLAPQQQQLAPGPTAGGAAQPPPTAVPPWPPMWPMYPAAAGPYGIPSQFAYPPGLPPGMMPMMPAGYYPYPTPGVPPGQFFPPAPLPPTLAPALPSAPTTTGASTPVAAQPQIRITPVAAPTSLPSSATSAFVDAAVLTTLRRQFPQPSRLAEHLLALDNAVLIELLMKGVFPDSGGGGSGGGGESGQQGKAQGKGQGQGQGKGAGKEQTTQTHLGQGQVEKFTFCVGCQQAFAVEFFPPAGFAAAAAAPPPPPPPATAGGNAPPTTAAEQRGAMPPPPPPSQEKQKQNEKKHEQQQTTTGVTGVMGVMGVMKGMGVMATATTAANTKSMRRPPPPPKGGQMIGRMA